MVYNRAYGVLACVAGRFPLKGNYTTKNSLCKSTVYEEVQKKRPVKTAAFLFSCHSFGNDVGKAVRGKGPGRLRTAQHCAGEERSMEASQKAEGDPAGVGFPGGPHPLGLPLPPGKQF